MKLFTTIIEEIVPKTFVLTEAQAFDLLLEAASLGDVYQKYYSQIPEEEFRQIVAADPTAGEDKMGKYSKWLLSLYINGEMLLEDLYKATDYLTIFHKYKGKLEKKDIGQYKSLPELYQAIRPYEDGTQAASHKEELRQIKKGAKKVYEDDEWLVVVPETKEAAIEYGKGTKWCTAATGSQNMFDYYHSQGTIYININKKTGKKLQFHFETEQFMDETDELFDKSEYHINDGLFNFYKQKYGKKALHLKYDIVGATSEGLTNVTLLDYDKAIRKHNFVDKNDDLVSPDLWFNNVSVFSEGFAAVYVAEMGCNYLKPDGTFLFKTWKDWYCHSFYNGFATVQHQFSKGYNAVNKNGELVSPNQWFSTIGYFENNIAKVGFDGGGYNIIRTDGSFVFENNYKYIGDIRSTYIKVKTYMDRYTFVNLNDELLINDNFVDASDFLENDYVWVKKIINGKSVQNFLTKNGDFMFKDWYDSIGGMSDEKFMLGKDGKKNIGDKNGNILFNEWYDSIKLPNNWGSFYYVKLNNKNNIINAETGEKVLDTWADRLYSPENSGDGCHVAMVKINNMYNTVFLDDRNCQAHIMFEEWFNLGVTSGGNVDYEFLLTNEPNCKPLYLISKDGSINDPREVQQESKQHNRSIIITEEQYGQILNESQESKSIAKAKKLVIDRFGWDNDRADQFVRIELRGDLPALRTRGGGKFILGVTRMFCDRQLRDANTIMNLNSTIELISSDAHINEYDQNLNGLSAQELIERFAGSRQELGNKDREENAALELQKNNDYTIVKIDDFEQSSKYRQYTDWCVTYDASMLKRYTSDGMGQFYFCLRNGFEDVPRKPGEGCPLDEYGLSMVAVSVDGDGNLNTCTCRWNHANGGHDHIMNTKQVSQLIGMNFYEVFKPNNKWKTTLEKAMRLLADGEKPENVFDEVFNLYNGIRVVKLLKNCNLIDENGKLLFPNQWFKSICDIDEVDVTGNNEDSLFVRLKKGGYYNFFDLRRKVLLSPNQWFDNAYPFSHGFANIELNGKNNFIDREGNIISPNQWFDDCGDFSNDGLAWVNNDDGKRNYIDGNGNILCPNQWFDLGSNFSYGFAKVRKEVGKWNILDKNGKILSPNMWFGEVSMRLSVFGFFPVKYEDEGWVKWNVIDKNGNLLSPTQWFDDVSVRATQFQNTGLIKVWSEGKINFLTTDKGLLFPDMWFNSVEDFANGIAVVRKDRKCNYINKEGQIFSPDKWFDWCRDFQYGFGVVELDNPQRMCNLFNSDGHLLSPEMWFDDITILNNEYCLVLKDNLVNLIKSDGKLVSPNRWFTHIADFLRGGLVAVSLDERNSNYLRLDNGEIAFPDKTFERTYAFNEGIAPVKVNGKFNLIDTNGEFISKIFFDNCTGFRNGFSVVKSNNGYNYIDKNGNLLSPNQWFDYASYFTGRIGVVRLDGKVYTIDNQGNLTLQENAQRNRSIIITEEQYRQILNESQESKSIAKAKKLLVDSMGWSKERADKFVRKDLRDLFSVLHHNSKAGKFILGLTRMYCNRQLTDGGQIQRLNSTIELVSSDAHINEYDQNLNGLSPQELINRFAGARQEMGNKDREENAGLDLQVNNDYTIVQIDNFEEAKKYGQYTSWCVTHSERMIDSYTSSGIGQFYFCLKNGFENVPAERGEGCPLDEYGLSMVAVSVDGDGNLNTCTCRWNHDNGGDDHIMDTKQVSQLIGRNFYDVFKPNNKWQKVVDQVIQRLANKEQLNDIFDSVQEETNFALVRLKQMYNFVRFDEEGWAELGSKHWFKSISTFNEKYLQVYNNSFDVNLVNIVTGELVFSQWFDRIDEIENAPRDLFRVKLEDETYNIFDQNGEMLLPEGMCSFIEDIFYCGYLEIHTEKGQNYVDENGKLLSPNQWFDYVYSMHHNFGIVCVPSTEKVQGGYNFIGVDGKLLSPNMNFSDVQNFVNGFGIVAIEKDGCDIFNFITTRGKLVSPNLWFDWVDMFSKFGFAEVKKDDKYNVIRTDGSLVSPNLWFDGLFNDFRYGFLRVKLDGKYNYLKLDGKLVSPNQWFDGVTWWTGGFGIVSLKTQKGRLSNYIDENGNILSPNQWFTEATFFHNGVATVRLEKGENWCYINTKGEIFEKPKYNENNQRGRSVIITEEQYRQILNESQESKSIEAAKTLVMKERGYSKEEADKFVRVTIRETFPNLRSREGGKFILGVTRIVLRGEINTGAMAQRLNDVIPYVASEAHINEYDRNLNGLSAEDLITKFEKNVNADLDKDREENAALNLQENNDYSIVQIDTFEEANKFSQYTDWCVTHYSSALDGYTSGGMGQFYFCLKKGFVNVPEKPGEGCPLDEYGLSMVAVSVNENGKLNTCTCRWNHDNGGNDNIMDTKQISQLIGRNFYEVFKPNNKWKITLEDAMQKLANGDALNDVFDWVCPQPCDNGWLKVQLKSKYNFVNDKNQLVLPEWYVYLENFICGTTIARDENDKRFIIDESGNVLFNRGFDYVSRDRVHKDIVIVEDENLGVNFIKSDGQLNNEWFDSVSYFGYNNRIAKVETPEGINYIRQNGEYVSQEWFDDGDTFEDRNYTEVKKERKYNLMDENGNILLPQWYDQIHDYYVDNLLSVSLDGKYNYLDTNGNPISKIWFDDIFSFNEGFAQVKANNLYNFIDSKGRLITDQWFKFAHKFVDGCAVVTLDTYTYVQNYLTTDRKFLSNTWFKEVWDFQKEYHLGRVLSKEDDKCYVINKNGEIISDGYDVICMYSCGFAKVINNLGGDNQYNFIDTNGKLLSPNQWFDFAESFYDDSLYYGNDSNAMATVSFNGIVHKISADGTLTPYSGRMDDMR